MPAPKGNNYAKGNAGGAPEGNQNAVGNSGGRPPEGNTNAATHSGYCDPLKHFDRLYGDARERADELIEGYRDDYALVHDMNAAEVEADNRVMNRFRALAAMVHQEGWVQYEVIENLNVEQEQEHEIEVNGETQTYTTEKLNPAFSANLRLASRIRNERRDLRIHGRAVSRARKERERRRQAEILSGLPPGALADGLDGLDADLIPDSVECGERAGPTAGNDAPTPRAVLADGSGESPDEPDGEPVEDSPDEDDPDEDEDENESEDEAGFVIPQYTKMKMTR